MFIYFHSWLLSFSPTSTTLRPRKLKHWGQKLYMTKSLPRNPVFGNVIFTTPWHPCCGTHPFLKDFSGSSKKKSSKMHQKWMHFPPRGLPACGREDKHLRNFQAWVQPQPHQGSGGDLRISSDFNMGEQLGALMRNTTPKPSRNPQLSRRFPPSFYSQQTGLSDCDWYLGFRSARNSDKQLETNCTWPGYSRSARKSTCWIQDG